VDELQRGLKQVDNTARATVVLWRIARARDRERLSRGTDSRTACHDARNMDCGDRLECLQCGHVRTADRSDAGECPRCRYLGWAPAGTIDEDLRDRLRALPLPRRLTGATSGGAGLDSAA